MRLENTAHDFGRTTAVNPAGRADARIIVDMMVSRIGSVVVTLRWRPWPGSRLRPPDVRWGKQIPNLTCWKTSSLLPPEKKDSKGHSYRCCEEMQLV